jgi:SAM-dependent methyltransferase
MIEESGVSVATTTYGASERKDVLPFIPATCRRLLDVGCGAGSFGGMLKRHREVEIWGVEPEPGRAGVAATRIDHVRASFYQPGIDLPKGYFDTITFNDSLEHFPDPEAALQLCKTHLAPEGVIVCSLPNFRFIHNLEHILFERDFRYEDDGIRDRTHLRFFTAVSMRRMFETNGFEVVHQQGINEDWWGHGELWRRLLLRFARRRTADMRFVQFINVARVRRV